MSVQAEVPDEAAPESVFGEYGRYYDLLYQDKDYRAESAFVSSRLRRYAPQARSLLELGCGTGRHAAFLADEGYQVTGLERSERMLALARDRARAAGAIRVIAGDVRHARGLGQFDVVLALFHVLSYQTDDADVAAVFETAREHLSVGGLLMFDVWHGPAVLAQKPEVRVKRVQDEQWQLTRIAEPVLDELRRTVEVQYTVFAEARSAARIHRLAERHRMRYFDANEIAVFAQKAGFKVLHAEEWMSGRPASAETWGVCYYLSKGNGVV